MLGHEGYQEHTEFSEYKNNLATGGPWSWNIQYVLRMITGDEQQVSVFQLVRAGVWSGWWQTVTGMWKNNNASGGHSRMKRERGKKGGREIERGGERRFHHFTLGRAPTCGLGPQTGRIRGGVENTHLHNQWQTKTAPANLLPESLWQLTALLYRMLQTAF